MSQTGWGLCSHRWGAAVGPVQFQRICAFLRWPAGSSQSVWTGAVWRLVTRDTVWIGWSQIGNQVEKHCIQPFKDTRLLQYPLPSVKVTSFSICPASRPVTVSWSWIMWTADWRSSIQTDWSVCSVRSGSSLLWAFPFQLRYNRLLILRIIFTDRPLSWNRSEFECRQKLCCHSFPFPFNKDSTPS